MVGVRSVIVALGCAACCPSELGDCDADMARQVYYDEDGLPAYAGQALVSVSCGDGVSCHSSAATGTARDGAPRRIDFDVHIAESDPERLGLAVTRARRDALELFLQVCCGEMPPSADDVRRAHDSAARFTDRDGRALAPIDTSDGLEHLRNWLACEAPVIERTTAHPAGTTPVGDVVPAR